MAKYTDRQIEAVIELQRLHEVPGHLTLDACEAYLDWHMATCTPEARGITSVEQAKSEGITCGLSIHEQQFRKLSGLTR